MLSNETLLGRVVYGRLKRVKHPTTKTPVNRKNDGEVIRVDSAFPAIIDQQTFDRVQAILSRNESTRPQGGLPGNTLRGIGKCGNCGRHLTYRPNSISGHWYYACGHRRTNTAADSACRGMIRADYADEVVALFLETMLDTNVTKLRKEIQHFNATAKDLKGLAPTEAIDLAISQQQSKVQNLVAAIANGSKGPTIFKALEEAEAKVAELQGKRRDLAAAVQVPTVDIDAVLSARADISSVLKKRDTRRMRAILAAIVAEVRCDWRKRKNPVVGFTAHFDLTDPTRRQSLGLPPCPR